MGKSTDKRNVIKRLRAVQDLLEVEMNQHSGSKIAGGLASEGFVGGYLMALRDVEAALTHGHPSDHYGYWRRAEREQRP